MKANYHSHTWRCNHAEGTEREMVERAIANGIQILGFSDHGPQIFPGEYYSNFRMRPEQLEDYVNQLTALREEFKDQIQIHIGLEMEYYPNLFKAVLPLLQSSGVEYMLMGQHFLGDEINENYLSRPTEEEATLQRYCHQVAEGMNTGLFTYVAHPDILNFVGDERIYRQHMRWLCKEANSCDLPLEVNLLGIRTKRNYPNKAFWQVAAEENCKVVIGRDAHKPSHFDRLDALEQGKELVKRYNLNLQETIQFHPIK